MSTMEKAFRAAADHLISGFFAGAHNAANSVCMVAAGVARATDTLGQEYFARAHRAAVELQQARQGLVVPPQGTPTGGGRVN